MLQFTTVIASGLLLGAMQLSAKPMSCAGKLMRHLGLTRDLHTDLDILESILTDDMHLSGNERITKRLLPQTPQPMGPMLVTIAQAIKTRHPALDRFACHALEHDLLPTPNPEIVRRSTHHAFLLEKLVNAMAADPAYMETVYEHILAQRAELGVREGFVGSTIDIFKAGGGIFGAVKAKTIDGVMKMLVAIRNRQQILPTEVTARKRGLRLNILEAYATDRVHGFYKNAMTGLVLTVNSPETIRVRGEHQAVEYVYPQEWTSLYQAWNLAFITGNVDNLDLVYPKLLIPAVLDAEPNDYLFKRVLALWTTINFSLFRKLDDNDDEVLPGKDALAEAWGDITYEYAMDYLGRQSKNSWANYLLQKKIAVTDLASSAWDKVTTWWMGACP